MAQGVGLGLDLTKIDQQLIKLNGQFDQLIKKGAQFKNVWDASFKNMGEGGLKAFAQELANLKKNVVDFGKQKVGVKWDSASLQKYIDDVQRLILVIKQVQKETKGKKDIKGVNIIGLKKEVKEAQELLRLVKRLEASQNKAKTNRQQTYSGALKYSSSVKTLEQERQAIANLEAARNKLKKTDIDYTQKLTNLNKRIEHHKREIDKATRSSDDLSKKHRSLMNTSDQLARKLALVFSVSQIQGYINKMISVRKEFELQQNAMRILLQNREVADKLWQQTIDLAVKSPFRIKELVTYTKQLAAYRIEEDKLHDTTKRLADVSAGLGVDMQRLILAYGQIRAASFLRGTELRQLTEAGIPMLEELASYFSEIEGRTVKVGEVFERISKRMVAFEDVEKVFKKITDEGGVFYKMQEEQSKTLHGQISNLYDSLDIMMNTIGESQHGWIQTSISLVKSLADNWRGVATVLKQVVVTLALIQMVKFVKGFNAVASAATVAATSMNGAALAGARFHATLSKIGTWMKANPWLLVIGAVISLGHAVLEYSDSIEATNKQYEENQRRLLRLQKGLEDIGKKIKENNEVIRTNIEEQKKLNKTDDEYAKTEKNVADARRENLSLLETLRSRYPDVYASITKQKDGTIELANAIKEQNRQTRIMIALQNMGKKGWFSKDSNTQVKEAVEAFSDLEGKLASLKGAVAEFKYDLDKAFLGGKINQSDYNALSNLSERLSNEKDFKKSMEYARLIYMYANKVGFANLGDAISNYNKYLVEFSNATNKFNSEWNDVEKRLQESLPLLKGEITTLLKDSNKERGMKKSTEYVDGILEEFKIVDEVLKQKARDYIKANIGIELVWKTDGRELTRDDLKEEWQRTVYDYIDEIEKTMPSLSLGVDINWIFDHDKYEVREKMKNFVTAAQEEASRVSNLNPDDSHIITNAQDIANAKKAKPILEELASYLELGSKKDKGHGAGKDWMSELVKNIKEAHKEYISLNKTLDETESKQMALAKYADVVAVSAKNAGISGVSLGELNFTTEQGTIDALEILRDKLPEGAKQARLNIEKALADIRGELRITTKKDEDKALMDSVESLFSNYEISLELDELNIPADLQKQIFNVGHMSLKDLRQSLEEHKSLFVGKDMEGEYDKFLKKLEDMEDKALHERAKKYSKYLAKSMSETVKFKLAEQRAIAEIDSLNVSDDVKESMRQGVRQETQKNIEKRQWADFKETDLYIEMFEDLDAVSYRTLKRMKEELTKMRDSLKNLDPSELKEIVSQIEKIDKEMMDKKPLEGFASNVWNYFKNVKKYKEAEKETFDAQEYYNSAKTNIDNLQLEIEEAKTNGDYERVESLGQELVYEKSLLDIYKKQLKIATAKKNEAKESVNTTKEQIQKVGSYISEAANALPQLMGNLQSMGVNVSDSTRDTIESISEIAGGVGSAIQGFASGNYIQGVMGAMQAISGVFKIGDKKREREIQDEIKNVERLQHAYEKLERAIENAYSVNTLQASMDLAESNIKEQIESTEKMIKAEEDKKDTDHERIEEWEREIESMKEQLEELENQRVESLGGIGGEEEYKAAAESFVDAWLSAYQETGDGLRGLEEEFDEVMRNLIKKQITLRAAQGYLEPLFKQIDKAVGRDSDIMLSAEEVVSNLQNMEGNIDSTMSDLNDMLSYLAQQYDIGDWIDGSSNLSGLQKGIQGVTEDTANIIASYLNSIRFFVAEKHSMLSQIVDAFTNVDAPNPMLVELRTQTELIRSINDMFGSVIGRGGSTHTGAYLKVMM